LEVCGLIVSRFWIHARCRVGRDECGAVDPMTFDVGTEPRPIEFIYCTQGKADIPFEMKGSSLTPGGYA
jgi:hypothetical protein